MFSLYPSFIFQMEEVVSNKIRNKQIPPTHSDQSLHMSVMQIKGTEYPLNLHSYSTHKQT